MSRFSDEWTVTGEELGRGGSGYVRVCAPRASSSQAFAVKVQRRDDVSQREAEVMQMLSHPNIIKIEKYYEEQSKLFIVMEKAEGGDLLSMLQLGHYQENEARELLRNCLLAIKHMHDLNIVHRDVKPDNFLLTSRRSQVQVKLSDFGYAAHVGGENGDAYGNVGTDGYKAPEVIMGRPYGKPADMFALGVTAFNVLGGYAPFSRYCNVRRESIYDAHAVVNGKFEFHAVYWGHASEAAKAFIRALLAVDPASRLTAEEALAHPWMAGDCACACDALPALLAAQTATAVVADNEDVAAVADARAEPQPEAEEEAEAAVEVATEVVVSDNQQQQMEEAEQPTPEPASSLDALLGQAKKVLAKATAVGGTADKVQLPALGHSTAIPKSQAPSPLHSDKSWDRSWPLLEVLFGAGLQRLAGAGAGIAGCLFDEATQRQRRQRQRQRQRREGSNSSEGDEEDEDDEAGVQPLDLFGVWGLRPACESSSLRACFANLDIARRVAAYV